jgi:hypothetical protein
MSCQENYNLLKTELEDSINKINPLILEIEETDNEIDQRVYDLYILAMRRLKSLRIV